MTCPSQLVVAAYEPSRGLRVQIALLYASRSQGARIPSCPMGVLNVTNFCVMASDGAKKELVSQNKHEPDDSVSIRFRRENYDAPEIGIASGRFTKENPLYAVNLIDTRCVATRLKAGAPGRPRTSACHWAFSSTLGRTPSLSVEPAKLDDGRILVCPDASIV